MPISLRCCPTISRTKASVLASLTLIRSTRVCSCCSKAVSSWSFSSWLRHCPDRDVTCLSTSLAQRPEESMPSPSGHRICRTGSGANVVLGSSVLCALNKPVQFNTGRKDRRSLRSHRKKPEASKSKSGMRKRKNLQRLRRHLVRRNTFSHETKVTSRYQPIPSHQKSPEAAFPA